MTNLPDDCCPDVENLLSSIHSTIQTYGLQIRSIDATDYSPSFSYSIGLFERYQHPEIICFGLSPQISNTIINHIAQVIQSGEVITLDAYYFDVFFENRHCQFLPVNPLNIADYFGIAQCYYQDQVFPAIQLIWTDRHDKFPWEDDFEDVFLYTQPLLDRNMHYKFRESENVGVFTTRQWLENNQPILTVIHKQHGDWQFLTAEPFTAADCKLVGLKHLIDRDPTLNELFDLQYGEMAERNFIGDEWIIQGMK